MILPGLLLLVLQIACAVAAEVSSNVPPVASLTPNRGIRIGERFVLKSAILNEQRPYWVYLPASYHDKEFAPERYPVLYLLDGSFNFQWASGVVQFMSENVNGNALIPKLIIVAIPNTHRTRDLTPTHSTKGYDGKDTATLTESGGGPLFLKFLETELIPRIEQNYCFRRCVGSFTPSTRQPFLTMERGSRRAAPMVRFEFGKRAIGIRLPCCATMRTM